MGGNDYYEFQHDRIADVEFVVPDEYEDEQDVLTELSEE
jgi:hypothetical protein